MPRVLPSTTALQTFEAAFRHGSCSAAAESLFMTQSAVSKQLQTLEESLGLTLFTRSKRGLTPTLAGNAYFDEVVQILGRIEAAGVKAARTASGEHLLTLRVLHTLGERWLLPRFSSFRAAYPEITIHFTPFLSRSEYIEHEPDASFRFGEGKWPGLESEYIIGRDTILVCSPDLLERNGSMQKVEDIEKYPLLHHFEVPYAWSELFSHLKIRPLQMVSVSRYEHFSVLISAAVSGLGLALIPRFYIKSELADGRLVNPLNLGFDSRYGYHLTYFPESSKRTDLTHFRKWLSTIV